MTPGLSRRVGSALGEHWVTYDERECIVGALQSAQAWSDLPEDIQNLISDVETRPLVRDGWPTNRGSLNVDDTPPAHNAKTYRIHGRPTGGLPYNIDVSQIDLTSVQAAWERQLARLLDAWVAVTDDQRRRIVEQVRAAVNNDDLNAIARMSLTSTDAANILTQAMNEMAMTAAQAMVGELGDQGVHANPVPGHPELHGSYAAATAALLAAAYANSASREALRQYSPAASGDEVAGAVGDYLGGLSDAFLRENLGGSLTAAQNDGRFETIKAAPEVALYASEVMDSNTCRPCREVNGKWLGNSTQMSMVYATYPNGGYVDCLGRQRCRGTVVAVYRPRQVDTNHGLPTSP